MSPYRGKPPSVNETNVVGARIGAQIIDIVAMFLQLLVAPTLIGGGRGGFFLGLLEGYWNGQTMGKAVIGIKVVDEQGGEVTVVQALVRNFPARFIPGWLASLVVLASMAMTDRR